MHETALLRLLILNIPRLTKLHDPDYILNVSLHSRLDKKQRNYLSGMAENRQWQHERILTRFEALKRSGEKGIDTNFKGLPQFSSGRPVSFSYCKDLAFVLYPEKKPKTIMALDAENIFSIEQTNAIKNFFIRLGFNRIAQATPNYITRLWTIAEAVFKLFSEDQDYLKLLAQIFGKPAIPCKFILAFGSEDILLHSFKYQNVWVSFAIFPSFQPLVRFCNLA